MSRYKGKNVKFLIDSGAHTYQNDLKYQDYDIDYWENHLRNYLNWAKKNREYIYAIVSFDFENLVGADVVSNGITNTLSLSCLKQEYLYALFGIKTLVCHGNNIVNVTLMSDFLL